MQAFIHGLNYRPFHIGVALDVRVYRITRAVNGVSRAILMDYLAAIELNDRCAEIISERLYAGVCTPLLFVYNSLCTQTNNIPFLSGRISLPR